MTGIELAGPSMGSVAQPIWLLAGAVIFLAGRRRRPRAARRLWLACGLLYLGGAGLAWARRPPSSKRDDPPYRARERASLAAALGISFLGASLASERLELLRD